MMPLPDPHRRALLKLAALGATATALPQRLFAAAQPAVERVLVVFKCHLDVGFTGTQAEVMQRYFEVYFPAAIERAAAMRDAGRDRYTWTTGSWLLYEYLEQAMPGQRAVMERAIAAGDISYHALPFSWQSEMLDTSMILGSLGFAAELDHRFGRQTIAAKMTDVPGHTRGLIAPLQAGGIRLLDIGVNAASYPPNVPDVFLWKDAEANSLIMLYHRHDYGSTVQIPDAPLAIAVEVRNDNSGPHTLEEIQAIYSRLRKEYPGAKIQTASLTDVALAIEPFRSQLPVITQEIGDTWIYGIPSDPLKVARYRETARLRQEWIRRGSFKPGDATDRQLLRRLLLSVEHTWGTDTKTYLDYEHYRPADLAAILTATPILPGYQTMLTSWQEKRDDLDRGLATLPKPLQAEAATRLAGLVPQPPSTDGMSRLRPAPHTLVDSLDTRHFTLAFDPATGAIVSLRSKATGHDFATFEHPLALFTYQTLSAANFKDFLGRYIQTTADWAPRDFGKPGIDALQAESRQWHPLLLEALHASTATEDRLVLHLRMRGEATPNTAWPAELFLELTLPTAEPLIQLRLSLFGKQANRLPEAMWLTFALPQIDPMRSTLQKVGEDIPFIDVVSGGGRSMHAVHDRVRLATPGGGLQITTMDAPVVAVGERTPLNFSPALPTLAGGVHFCLYNNAWGTNYPQWAAGDWSYRFTLQELAALPQPALTGAAPGPRPAAAASGR